MDNASNSEIMITDLKESLESVLTIRIANIIESTPKAGIYTSNWVEYIQNP